MFCLIFSYINNYLETRELNSQRIEPGWESTLEDIVIQGKNSTRIPRKHVCIFL